MHRLGFTLVELIVTLVIVAFLGMMAVSFFQRSVTQQDVAVTQLKADASLQLVLENMIQAYASNEYNNNTNLTDLYGNIDSAGTVNSTKFGNVGNGKDPIAYYVAEKNYVCPNATTKTFDPTNDYNQFMLLTIKSSATSGVGLSYIFAVNTNSSVTINACP